MKTNGLLYGIITFVAIAGFTWYGKSMNLLTPIVNNTPDKLVVANFDDTSMLSPTVLVQTEKMGMQPLLLNECSMELRCNGSLLETEMVLTYENLDDRMYEGSFYFPLQNGQFITGLELEQNGEFQEASIVKKDIGRIAFEATERKQIDPALLEWTQGNNFKLRVYPIPAKGKKQIKIRYAQALKQNSSGLYFDVPLHFRDRLKKFNMHVTFPKGTQFQTTSADEIAWSKDKPWEFTSNKEDVYANQPIRFNIPLILASQATLVSTASSNVVITHMEIPNTSKKKVAPKELTILWDVSMSSSKRDVEREGVVLTAYLKSLKQVKLHLIAFSNAIHYRKDFNWTGNESTDEFMDFLYKLPNDGGTQLGCLKSTDLLGEEILLFSDCMSNFGSDDLPIKNNQRLVVLSSSSEKDISRARRFSIKNGDVLNLNELSAEECIVRLMEERLRLLHVKGVPDSLVTGIGIPVDNFFVNSLKLPNLTVSNLEFEFGVGEVVMERVSVQIPGNKEENYLGERFWSNMKLQDLDIDYETNEGKMTRIALDQKLISRYTSLLVLEDLEDYLKYDILPPKKLLSEFYERKKTQEKQDVKDQTTHEKSVEERWSEIKTWYSQIFEQKKTQVVSDSTRVFEDSGSGNGHGLGSDGNGFVTPTGSSSNATYQFNAISMDAALTSTTQVDQSGDVSIKLEEWNPNMPYMKAIKSVLIQDAYAVYLRQKETYGSQPSFFIDVSDYFRDMGKKELALRILSNLAELELENPQLLRVLAHRLDQIKEYDLAISVFKEVKKLRSEEPQSYRDLALVLEKKGYFLEADEAFRYVVEHEWDGRFHDVEVISLIEWNHMLSLHPAIKSAIKSKFKATLPVDTRVIITWDTDNCDMDLWVTDPNGEKCYYSNTLTQVGGRISKDCTQGYGPEEFMLKKAPKGKYKVQIDYFGSSAQTITGPTTVQVKMITNYGRPNEKIVELTRRLQEKKEVITIGEFEVL